MNDPVREELRFHIEERTRELVEAGVPEAEARRQAEASFGHLGEITEEVARLQRRRDRRRSRRGLAESAVAGVRGIVRQPRYAGLVIGTLALGIGAACAIFSVVDAVLLDPLPFEDPARLVRVWESDLQRPERNPAPADFLDLRDLGAFSSVSAYVPRGGNLLGDGHPERIRYADVSANFFHTLGVQPRLGRSFGPETVPAGTRVAVVSHGLWTRRWGADPGIVGRTFNLDGEIFEVMGVAPEGLDYPADVVLWVAAEWDIPAASFFGEEVTRMRDAWFHRVVARLAPGHSLDVAGDQVAALASELSRAHPETFGADSRIWVTPLHEDQVGDLDTALLLLLGATFLVLLIVSANVANLALVRAAGRAREWGIRLALGAPRSRIVALVLSESLVLALGGGAIGVGLAVVAVEAVRPLVEPLLPVTASIGVDPTVLAFALFLSTSVALGFGLAPALLASHRTPGSAIDRGAGSRAGSRRDRTLRGLLVGTEVALAVVLVLGAGLLVRSLASLRTTDLGFETAGLVTMSVGYPGSGQLPAASQTAYYDELTSAVARLPGVERVGWGQFLPSEVGAGAGLRIEGFAEGGPDESVRWHAVSTDYVDAIGARLLDGRSFLPSDDVDGERVAIVNRTLARRWFPDGDAIGSRVATGLDGQTEGEWNWARVVGVIEDTRNLGPARPAEPMLYRPMRQEARGFVGAPRAVLHLRTGAGFPGVAPVRDAIRGVNPDAPVDEILQGDEIAASYLSGSRLVLSLLGSFAGLALLLGALGIYGLTRFAVQRRTREIGVRMAIGAGSASVVSLVVRQGMVPALAGVAVGLVLAAAARGVLENRLHGISALDPLTWVTVPAVLLAVAVLATWLPARRAARIDPVQAIRVE